ncbi:hypothetical protein COY28_01000 [Candidatus Woesearchaeota archaeon CG_4_10_14_0_2_um_filter_57_5]|nr:MAG: hypothetical protein AUJ68_03015 [Candidatus Woesearchaeota archaeon CG1_02_57_44]PIZ56349.1 MAG: hypothetical protein COY28_01000 [Candidatus Woesearchaeota archaeon CG_4_10_14_0_2_um_filter_57_5]
MPSLAVIGDSVFSVAVAKALVSKGCDVPWLLLSQGIQTSLPVQQFRTHDELAAIMPGSADYFLLAFYSKRLPPSMVCAHWGRLWNLHASLLPTYRGVGNPLGKALSDGLNATGITVHLVAEQFDAGPVLGQLAMELPVGASVQDAPALYRSLIVPLGALLAHACLARIDTLSPLAQEQLRRKPMPGELFLHTRSGIHVRSWQKPY